MFENMKCAEMRSTRLKNKNIRLCGCLYYTPEKGEDRIGKVVKNW